VSTYHIYVYISPNYFYNEIYRVIHKSLRDFRPLRYSNQDGHAEEERVNRGRDTPSFCLTLQVFDMSTLGDAADVKFGKFQDTERFLIPWPRHVSSELPPSGETCKYTKAPSAKKKTWRHSVPIDVLLSALSVFVVVNSVRKFRRDLWITLYFKQNIV
jgi:hypothetical protein